MTSIRKSAYMLFTRIPLPGAVKARLSPVLSPSQRASLQEALVIDTVAKLLELDGTVILCCSDEHQFVSDGHQLYDAFIRRVYDACTDSDAAQRLVTMQQRGNDLGNRMSNALKDVLGKDACTCLLLGSDLPYITPSDITVAERLLDDADVVFGPSPDGGYWLVGMKKPFPELFAYEQYGRGDVLEHALEICKRHDKKVAFAPPSSDVDVPQDYKQLRKQVIAGDERIGLHTKQVIANLVGEATGV